MERVRQITAVFVGILVIVVLILLARWTGDKIRERFLSPKPVVVTKPASIVQTLKEENKVLPAATYSAIPSTGPANFGYFLIAMFFLSGLVIKSFCAKTIFDH